jgi:hypothetical protein
MKIDDINPIQTRPTGTVPLSIFIKFSGFGRFGYGKLGYGRFELPIS